MGNPFLDESAEFVGLPHEFSGLGFGRHVRRVVVDDIPLPPTGVEVGRVRESRGVQYKAGGFERSAMVAEPRSDAVTSAREDQLA